MNTSLVEAEIGTRPEHWKIARLGDVAKTSSGGTPSRSNPDLFAGLIPWVKSGELEDNIVTSTEENISEAAIEVSSAKIFPAGTLLMAMYGATAGKTALLGIPAATNQAVCAIFPKADVLDAAFLRYFLIYVRPSLLKERFGGAQPNISQQIVQNTLIIIPPLPEQRTVAAILSKIHEAVEVQEKLVGTLKELKAATMAKLFREGLRGEPARSETRFGQVPQEWKIEGLSEHAYVQTGVAKGRKIDNSSAIELPYLRVANVQDGYLDLSEIKTIRLRNTERERYSLQVDDVLLTEGGDFDKLGRGYLWKGQIKNCVHQNHIFAVRTNRKVLLPEFFVYLVQSPYGKAYFLSVAHKTTNLACINSHKLKAFPLLLPSLAEQHEIATILTGIDQKIDQHTDKLKILKHLFSSMLHLLMTGQVRVKI
jgi:type I restriction enzyme, S subunit